MKTICILACTTLLAGCNSASLLSSPWPAKQTFGYAQPATARLALPSPPPASAAQAPAAAAALPVPTTAAVPVFATLDQREAPYDERKDPMMRALVAQAMKPVDEDLRMTDGKIVLPPAAKLEIIDVRDISGALANGATPSP